MYVDTIRTLVFKKVKGFITQPSEREDALKNIRKTLKLFLTMLAVCVMCIVMFAQKGYASDKPGKVTGIKIEKSYVDGVKVTYDKLTGAAGYEIEIYTTGGKKIDKLATKYCEKRITGLSSATPYKIRVRAYKWNKGKKVTGLYSEFIHGATLLEEIEKISSKIQSETSVTITWNKVSRGTGYYIYVWDSNKKGWKFLKGSATPKYTAKDLKSGKYYEYLIKPFYKYKDKTYIGQSERIKVISSPAGAVNIENYSPSFDKMNISWGKSLGATGYEIKVYENGKLFAEYLTKYNTRTLSGLNENSEYTISVKPYIYCTKYLKTYGSKGTVKAYTNPKSVKNFSVVDVGNDYITIAYKKVENIDDYVISYYSKSNPKNVIEEITNQTNYKISSLVPGEEYVITVHTRKTLNGVIRNGEISKEKTVYALPKGIDTQEYRSHSKDGLTVLWEGSKKAATYAVYYKKDGDTEFTIAGRTNNDEYEIKGLEPGTKYWVYIASEYEIEGKVYTLPGNVTYTYTAPDKVKLNGGYTEEGVYEITWTDTTGRTAFELRKYNDKTGKWEKVTVTTKTKYTYKVTDSTDSCRFKVRPYIKTEDGEYIWGEFSDNVEINAGRWGIDVSKHQGKIDWEKVAKSGVQFAIIRVGYRGYSYGTIVEDPYFEENIKGALANGIDVGIYFFSTAISEKEAIEEAEWTLNRIRGYNVTYPIVFDYEGYENPDYRSYGQTRTNRSNYAIAFLDYIRSKGYIPMMYASQYYYNTQWDTDRLSDYNLWVAKYPSGNNGQLMVGSEPKINYPYAMWQYSSTGKVDGIQAANGDYRNVDMNYQYTSFKK